jgi:hypothetical protein
MVEKRQKIQSGGGREKFAKSTTVAHSSLVNANAHVMLLQHFAKYHILVVQWNMCVLI